MIFKILFVIGLFLMLSGNALATDYYVSTTGNDENTGLSVEQSWLTPSHAATQAIAGDTIYIIDGLYQEELIIFSNNGTSENLITMIAYNGTPHFDGIAGATHDDDDCFRLQDTEYITIQGIHVSNYTHALDVERSNNILVRYCEFSGVF